MIEIIHNPKCSKSRETLKLLNQWNVEPKIRLYLEDKLTKSELIDICSKLGISPVELLRKNEIEVKDFVGEFGTLNDSDALRLMMKFPKVIERPIVINADIARIGRPPENVLEVL